MHFYRNRVGCGAQSAQGDERNGADQSEVGQNRAGQSSSAPRKQVVRKRSERLRAVAGVLLTLAATMPAVNAQQAGAISNSTSSNAPGQTADKAASELPAAPAPVATQPYPLRTTSRDYSKPFGSWLRNPIGVYMPTNIPKASFNNSVRLTDLVKDGKIYLSLSDAIALAIENNYDIAIARYDLDIADTDILRTRAGGAPLGAPSGLVTGTLGGSTSTLSTGGGPGGTAGGAGGAGSGVNGLTLTTAGAGPLPENLDPVVGGTIQLQRQKSPEQNIFTPRSFTNTDSYDFTFGQGFVTGTSANLTWNNSRTTTTGLSSFSPQLFSNFNFTVTQHVLQGAGIWVNKRFMYQALNDRRITDSSFRQQILYTVNQVETIYWGLVQAYEDVQARERGLDQSNQLLSDNRKQLQIGTMAPLDVVNAESSVATDQQGLISAQSALNYQQEIMKQAIARNLNDPALSAAPVIPTDRVTLEAIQEESQPVEALVQEAFQQRPELEQAVLTLKNDAITLKGARNALMPTLDISGFYGAQSLGGEPNVNCNFAGIPCAGTTSSNTYPEVLSNLANGSSPNKGVEFSFQLPLRNREAQSVQERSLMEYRQAELRLEQLHTEIRMQVVNAMFALNNDRAQVRAALAARDYAQQSLDAEQKKLHLGASTTANVLLQERSLASMEDSLIAAHAAYAKDRSGLYQTLASTLQHYNINLTEAASGTVTTAPVVPGVEAAPPGNEPTMIPPATPEQPAPAPPATQ